MAIFNFPISSIILLCVYAVTSAAVDYEALLNALRDKMLKQAKPNIVLVVSDDQGFNDIGYHNSEVVTPNLDSLSKNGVRIEHHYAQPKCSPSRSSLMSGKYLTHLGLQHATLAATQKSGLPLHSVTLPDRLKSLGYSTHMFGKWHLGFFMKDYTPTYRGFDTFYGLYESHGTHYTHEFTYKYMNGKDLHDDSDKDLSVVWNNEEYSTLLFTRKAQKVIENHDTDKPLFLYVSYQAPHAPLEVPEKYEKIYESETDENRRKYLAMITCLDEGVGNITDSLKSKGMWDNTVFIYFSDNGGNTDQGASNYPLNGDKGTYWDGGIRTLAFVHSNLIKNPGQEMKGFMHISDWYPTIVGVAGGKIPEDYKIDGVDVWGAISSNQESPRNMILHNIDPMFKLNGEKTSDIFDNRVLAALRYGKYKIMTGTIDSNSCHDCNEPEPDGDRPGPDGDRPRTNDDTTRRNGNRARPNGITPDSNRNKPNQNGNNTQTNDEDKNIWLFDMENDPYEENDISDENPEVVSTLLELLALQNSTALPVFYPPSDNNANPSLHGGAWVPWVE